MIIKSFEPGTSDFYLYLTLAWRWMKDRPHLFPHDGASLTLYDYLSWVQQPEHKPIAIFDKNAMIVLVSIIKEPKDTYNFHVVSPRKSNLEVIAGGVYLIGFSLFAQLGAQAVYTMSPTYKGKHKHRGSHLLAQLCGLTLTGHIETDGNKWEEYKLTRSDWLKYHVQAEDRAENESNAESISKSAIQSESGLYARPSCAAV